VIIGKRRRGQGAGRKIDGDLKIGVAKSAKKRNKRRKTEIGVAKSALAQA